MDEQVDSTLATVAPWYTFHVLCVSLYEHLRVRTAFVQGRQGRPVLATCLQAAGSPQAVLPEACGTPLWGNLQAGMVL